MCIACNGLRIHFNAFADTEYIFKRDVNINRMFNLAKLINWRQQNWLSSSNSMKIWEKSIFIGIVVSYIFGEWVKKINKLSLALINNSSKKIFWFAPGRNVAKKEIWGEKYVSFRHWDFVSRFFFFCCCNFLNITISVVQRVVVVIQSSVSASNRVPSS